MKDRALAPATAALAGRVAPVWVTALALALSVGAGVAASLGLSLTSVTCWLAGRVADGLDGPVARRTATASDLGGYLDMVADTIGYALVPLGIANGQANSATWAACALLLATFYLNTISWTYLAAIAEKRATGARHHGETTSVHMPGGLIEGTETIVFYTAMLLLPTQATVLFVSMAALVLVTVAQRVTWAAKTLQ